MTHMKPNTHDQTDIRQNRPHPTKGTRNTVAFTEPRLAKTWHVAWGRRPKSVCKVSEFLPKGLTLNYVIAISIKP